MMRTLAAAHLRENFGDAYTTVNASPNGRFDGVEGDGDMVYAASKRMFFSAFVDKLSEVVAKERDRERGRKDSEKKEKQGDVGAGGVAGTGTGTPGTRTGTEKTPLIPDTERVYMSEISGHDYAMRCDVESETCRAAAHKPEYLEPMVEDGVSLPPWYPHDMGQPFIAEPLRNYSKIIIWITGGSNVTARAHYDPPHNFYAIITGTKTFYLAPPEDAASLYYGYRPAYRWVADDERAGGRYYKSRLRNTFSNVFSPVDLSKPDFKKHPKARAATLFKCELAAGDVLYMPPEYWHQVESKPGPEGISIALNFWQTPHLGRVHLARPSNIVPLLRLVENSHGRTFIFYWSFAQHLRLNWRYPI